MLSAVPVAVELVWAIEIEHATERAPDLCTGGYRGIQASIEGPKGASLT